MGNIDSRARAAKSAKEKSVKEKPALFNAEGTITVRLGATINKGNYESARVDIGITVPFDANSSSNKEKIYKEAKEWAANKIKEELHIMGKST